MSDVGKWVQDQTVQTPLQGLGIIIVHDHLELLPDESTYKHLEQCEQEKDEFFEWFKEEQKKLEYQYHNCTGESKISAAKNLIEFIREALEKWGKIKNPIGGKWSGFHKITVTMHAIQFNMEYKSNIDIVVNEPLYMGGPSQVTGTLSDGLVDFEGMRGLMKGKSSFKGELSGQIFNGSLSLIMTECLQDLNLNVLGGFASGSVGVVGATSRKGIEGLKKYKGLVRILNKEIPTETITINCTEQHREFAITGYDEFQYLEHLQKYFIWLVRTTDEVRSSKYSSCSLQEKMQLANETLAELLRLLSFGQSLAIPSTILRELSLVINMEDSLYDKWFRLWFLAGRQFWQELVFSNPSIDNYQQRLLFFLKAAENIFTGVISKKPFEEYQLTVPGETIDAVFVDYYNYTFQYWFNRVLTHPNEIDTALRWEMEMSSVVMTGMISNEIGQKLGLIPLPSVGFNQLLKAAGRKEIK